MDQFENRPPVEHKGQEVKENLEVIKEEFEKLKNTLEDLVAQLNQEGSLVINFSKGLNLEQALERMNNSLYKLLPQDRPSANNFAFMLFASGVIYELARNYSRIKAFYREDQRFQSFCQTFENFVQVVNNNNTEIRIKNIPELLIPINSETQVIEGDFVDKEYADLPGVREKVRERMKQIEQAKEERVVVDFYRMSAYVLGKDGTEKRAGSEAVIIATHAFW